MQNYWWVWFPGIETRILEPMNISAKALEPNRENLHPRKFPATRYIVTQVLKKISHN